jgi:hypothetical protein
MSLLISPSAETRVNTTTANDQWNPSIAALPDGGYVVTWTSYNQDGSGWGVYAQRYDASGNTVGSETRVNTTTSSEQWFPSIAALPDGGYVVKSATCTARETPLCPRVPVQHLPGRPMAVWWRARLEAGRDN